MRSAPCDAPHRSEVARMAGVCSAPNKNNGNDKYGDSGNGAGATSDRGVWFGRVRR